jgi:hypothetical protein
MTTLFLCFTLAYTITIMKGQHMASYQKPFLFSLGQVVATPAVLKAFERTGETPQTFLSRHARGDWGTVSAEDARANTRALKDGSRIFSAYKLKDGQKFWIITEAVGDDDCRASTCVLLPDDY